MRKTVFSAAAAVTLALAGIKFPQALSYAQSLLSSDTENDIPDGTLYAGATDMEGVFKLGENLQTLGYDIGVCGNNGLYTAEMEDAVMWFQRRNGFEVNGIATPTLQNAIQDAADNLTDLQKKFAANSKRYKSKTITASVTGHSKDEETRIRRYQIALVLLGYGLSDCMANGQMDTQTVDAVKRFQTEHEIYPVTGNLDLATQDTLEQTIIKRGNDADLKNLYHEITSARSAEIEPRSEDVRRVTYMMRAEELRERRDYYVDNLNVPEYLADDIYEAALQTGWDIDYLFRTAAQESGNRPWVRPDCSRCTTLGIFQFIEQTWLAMFKGFAGNYGYQNLVDEISTNANGYHSVKGEIGEYILNLRTDTRIASLLAAELAREEYNNLRAGLGGDIGKTEVHLGHVLGSGDAIPFLRTYRTNPDAAAAELFPKAASQNLHLFYVGGDTSKPRSVKSIYNHYKRKIAPNGDNALNLGPRINPDYYVETAIEEAAAPITDNETTSAVRKAVDASPKP